MSKSSVELDDVDDPSVSPPPSPMPHVGEVDGGDGSDILESLPAKPRTPSVADLGTIMPAPPMLPLPGPGGPPPKEQSANRQLLSPPPAVHKSLKSPPPGTGGLPEREKNQSAKSDNFILQEPVQGSLPRPPSYTTDHQPVFPPGVSLIPPLPRLHDPYVHRPVAQHMPQPAPMGSLPIPPSYTTDQQPVFPPGVSLIPPLPRLHDPYVHRPVAQHMPQPAPMGSPPRPPSYTADQQHVFPPGVSLIPPLPRLSAPGQHDPYVHRPVAQHMPQPAPMGSLLRPPSYTTDQQPIFSPGVSLFPPLPRLSAPGQHDPYVHRPVAQHMPQPAPMPANPYGFPLYFVQPQPQPVLPHIPAPPSTDYFSPPFPPSSPAPPINRGSQPANPYHFPPYVVPPQPVQPQPVPPHIPAPPSADYFSPPLPPSSPAPPINRARDSEYWGEKAREWVAAQDPSDVSVTSSSDYDYRALLDCEDLVFPLEVPILPWMKMELARMDNIASRTTEKKVKAVDVSVDVLSKILGLFERYNPDRSPHKYEVSPSPVPNTRPFPPTSQAPSPSPSHLESARTADASDSSRSRHKRQCSTVGSDKRSKRPKLGEG